VAHYIGAIDQGTTSTRFCVFDAAGKMVAVAQKEHQQIYPQPGWVEHNPEEIWQATQDVMAQALQQGKVGVSDLAAIGITNQRETTVLWNRKTGKPVANALVWQDTRVDDYVAELSREGGADRFRRKTGLPLSTYFSSLKIRWLLDHVPGVRKQAETGEVVFGNIDSFLTWHLTGGPGDGLHITDVTNASRTQLMDLDTLSWDQDLLDAFEIPQAMLPRICSSGEAYGTVKVGAANGVAIAGILGDQQAALVGQACFKSGEAKNTYGTGCFLLMNTGERAVRSGHGLLTTVAYKFGKEPARYALEGSIAITGALVQWLRDNPVLPRPVADYQNLVQDSTADGPPQIRFQIEKRHSPVVHASIKYFMPRFPKRLGTVHCRVGIAQAVLRFVVAMYAEGDPDACRGEHLVPAEVERTR
jgi:glycerol kinase